MTLPEAVRDGLAALCTLPFPPTDLQTMARIWLQVCADERVTPEEFAAASMHLVKTCERCPVPKQLLDAILLIRAAATRERFRSLVPATDRNGMRWAAPPELVDKGRYLGPVPNLADGKAHPALPSADKNALGDTAPKTLPGPGGCANDDGVAVADGEEAASKRSHVDDAEGDPSAEESL